MIRVYDDIGNVIETQAQREALYLQHKHTLEALLQALQDKKQAEHGRNVIKHLKATASTGEHVAKHAP